MTQREFLTSVLTLGGAPMETLEYARASLDKMNEKNREKSRENELLFTNAIFPYICENNTVTIRQIREHCCFLSYQKLTAIIRPYVGTKVQMERIREGSSVVVAYTAIK